MATKFKHQSKKKIAIVTPEQRTKKSFPAITTDTLKTKQDENNVIPTFSLNLKFVNLCLLHIDNKWQ